MNRDHSFKLLLAVVGVLIITIVLYYFILRHPGYIFFGDLSGGFPLREPFSQYILTESFYDGLEIATKSRLPIITIFWFIWKSGSLLFGWGQQDVIKIALYSMFTGTFLSFYYSFPVILKAVNHQLFEKKIESKGSLALIFFLSLMYGVLPIYTVRIEHLQLFLLPLFIPLVIAYTLELIQSKSVSLKNVLYLVIIFFFGITSPHSLAYYAIICISIGGIYAIGLLKSPKQFSIFLINIGLLIGITVVTNLYWIIPYFITKQPEPGYVVSNNMIDFLGLYSTFKNFILGTADWFHSEPLIISSSSIISILQVVGVVSLYAVAIKGISTIKDRRIIISFVVLLVIIFLLAVKGTPFFTWFYTVVVYSPIGWLLREVNRISLLWWALIYILFGIGVMNLEINTINETHLKKIPTRLFICMLIFSVFVYEYPAISKYVVFLKPTVPVAEYQAVDAYLKSDSAFYNIYWLQNNSLKIPWVNPVIAITDYTSVRALPYNLARPAVQNNSVLPYGKTEEQLIVESFVDANKYDSIAAYLASHGVKYIVLDKVSFGEKYKQIVEGIVNVNKARVVLANQYYFVIRLETFRPSFAFDNKSTDNYYLGSADGIIKLSGAGKTNFKLPFFEKSIRQSVPVFTDMPVSHESIALDLMTNDIFGKYRIIPFDNVHEFGLNFAWARASTQDKINGEFHNVLRAYAINDLSLAKGDKIIYSDIKLTQPSARAELILKVNKKCSSIECVLWANVYKNPKGGKLRIEVDGKTTFISSLTTDGSSSFVWEKIAVSNAEKIENIVIESVSGFNAVGSLVFIPNSELQRAVDDVGQVTQVKDYQYLEEMPACSTFKTTYEDGLIPQIKIDSVCDFPVTLTIKNRLREFTLVGKKNSYISEFTLQGKQSTVIQVNSMLDDSIWILLMLSFAEIGIIVIYLVYSNEHERSTKISR